MESTIIQNTGVPEFLSRKIRERPVAQPRSPGRHTGDTEAENRPGGSGCAGGGTPAGWKGAGAGRRHGLTAIL